MRKMILLMWLFVTLIPLATAIFRLQVLHNSDMHCRFNETEVNPDRWKCTSSSDQCVGGFARVRQAVNKFAEEAKKDANTPTIFLNAGDNFQGTPYFVLEKWRIVAPLVDVLGINAMCLGNHEFDHGIDSLVEFLNLLRTPMVVCNLDLTTEKRLQKVKKLQPSIILNAGTQRIGVIGYLTPRTRATSNAENLQFFDEIDSVRKEARRLMEREEDVKIIIALGHSGFKRDIEIATEVEEISMVVGGDSDTLLYTPKKAAPSTETASEEYPFMVTQKSGKKVPVVHAWSFTKYLGRLFVEFDEETGNVISAKGNPVLLDSSIEKDIGIQELIDSWTKPLDEQLSSKVGYLRVPLYRCDSTEIPLIIETTAGNFITDALQNYSVKLALESNASTWTRAPIALYNRGGIRNDLLPSDTKGSVTLADIYSMVPFINSLYEVELKGRTLWKVLEIAPRLEFDKEGILDSAGMRIVYDLEEGLEAPNGCPGCPECRLSSVQVLCKECLVPRYEDLDLDKTYTIITVEALLRETSIYGALKTECISMIPLPKSDTEVVAKYFQKLQYVHTTIEGRIRIRQVPRRT